MKVLVTGGVGLIGREVVARLAAAGHELSVLDLRADGESADLTLERIRGDLLDPRVRRESLKGVDGVIHLAAVSRVVWAEADPANCIKTNVLGTLALLEDAASQPRPPWIMYGSSREVYGESDTLPVREDFPLRPKNVYGLSKVAAEAFVRRYGRMCKVPTAILRFSNVYGSVHDRLERVVPRFILNALNCQPLELHGGEQTFDFTHVDDVRRAVLATGALLSQQRGHKNTTLHILPGRETSLRQLASLVRSYTGADVPVVMRPPRNYDVQHFVGDPTAAKDVLGFECQVQVPEGIQRTMKEYRRAFVETSVPNKDIIQEAT